MTRHLILKATILTLTGLTTACTMQPGIQSSSEERIIIKGDLKLFMRAYDIAKGDAKKTNARSSTYPIIPRTRVLSPLIA